MEAQQVMQMVVIPQQVWEEVLFTLNVLQQGVKEKSQEWLPLKEALKVLNIGKTTWNKYAAEGRIPYSQIGRKIMLKKSDIDKFLNSQKI